MRFRDNRITLVKDMIGAEIPPDFDPSVLATPREVANKAIFATFRPVPNRAKLRSHPKPRTRKRGVAQGFEKPWAVKRVPSHYEIDDSTGKVVSS